MSSWLSRAFVMSTVPTVTAGTNAWFTSANRYESVLMSVCPYCYAPKGEDCVTSGGRRAQYAHAARYEVRDGDRVSGFLITEEPW